MQYSDMAYFVEEKFIEDPFMEPVLTRKVI